MPPKVAADAAAKPAKAKADKTATAKAEKAATTKAEDFLNHPETKLMWAILCDLSKDGKMTGFNWEDVKVQIEASTAHAARQRWDKLKAKMTTKGLELPAARAPGEAKAKVVKPKATKAPKATTAKQTRGKKAKATEEAEINEEGEGSAGEGEVEDGQEGSGEDGAEDESG